MLAQSYLVIGRTCNQMFVSIKQTRNLFISFPLFQMMVIKVMLVVSRPACTFHARVTLWFLWVLRIRTIGPFTG